MTRKNTCISLLAKRRAACVRRWRCPRLVARRACPARGRTEALDQFAVVSVQLAALAEQLRPLARLYAARPRAAPDGGVVVRSALAAMAG